MRLFFGLEPPADATRAIADWRDRTLTAQGRPVPQANFHITLAFLGEVSEHRLERLCTAVDDFVDNAAPRRLALEFNEPGFWPRPRIYWLGPATWPGELDTLARKLEQLGVAEGGKRKRGDYRPHITLFRGCELPPPAPILAPDFHLEFDHFTLFESRQGRGGVRYEAIASWRLS